MKLTWKPLMPAGAAIALTLILSPALAISHEAVTPDGTGTSHGAYLARLGDCVGCHTAPGGKQMAGGLALKSPMGVIYSTNITPDNATGIGGYSFEQFDRAMRKGVAADGRNLYPAMPYPSYARVANADMRTIYAYLMGDLAPVNQANRQSRMTWPFSIRWGLSLWRGMFLNDTQFKPNQEKSAECNRGAYLVQGLGHCGACHTPRGIALQEKAMSDAGDSDNLLLSGETMENWRAVNLRNLAWTMDDLVLLLKTGRNRFAAVSGNMVDVVRYSTQYFDDPDLFAVAAYLKSLPPGKEDLPMSTARAGEIQGGLPKKLFTVRGGLGYVQFCVDCHRPDGSGVQDIFPPLAGNPALSEPDATSLAHIALTGWKTAQTDAYPRVYTMPAFSHLSDKELTEILSFVIESWGRADVPLSESAIRKTRAELAPATEDSSKFVTPRLADMLSQPNAEQLVRGMRLHLETKELLPQNVNNELNCASCHLNCGTVADGAPFVGVSAFFPGYSPRAGRVISLEDRINACFLRSMNGRPLPNDSADMKAMVAYFNWMKGDTKPQDKVAGRGIGKVDRQIEPNMDNGGRVFKEQCGVCHGHDGEGLITAQGQFVYPPLWGEKSFNIGAGMARTYTAAAFVKRNMPIAFQESFPLGQGGLSDKEAGDVAEYFSHQPRPDFPRKVNDWPKDPKPEDARY